MKSQEASLEQLRDQALGELTDDEIRWAMQSLTKPQQQNLLRVVGLKLNPKFLKSSVGQLIQARATHLKGAQRWQLAKSVTAPCLSEFERELGLAFSDPTEQHLRDVIPRIEMRCGRTLVRLTLMCALNGEAVASKHIRKILGESEPLAPATNPSEVVVDATHVEKTSNSDPTKSDHSEVDAADITFLPISRMRARLASSQHDSDATYYSALLLTGELLTKLVALSLIASIDPERDEAQTAYARKYELVRADSVGSWSRVIQDLTTAPVYRLLDPAARDFHSSLTQRFGRESDTWQREANIRLMEAASFFPNLASDPGPGKVSLAQWFQMFAALRNKTRGHGADLISWQSSATAPLADSVELLVQNLKFLQWPWWFIRRTAAGVPKVYPMSGSRAEFQADAFECEDGTHVSIGDSLRRVELLTTNPDVDDFYLPNGDAQDGKGRYEELSYVSGVKRWANLSSFLRTPRELPLSETHGSAELRAVGNVLTNLPETGGDYVSRHGLEDELHSVLTDTRHPVVAINGPGGIGKTSLALRVLHGLAELEAFSAILWFSARDIDLDSVRGPLAVKPAGQSLTQFARQYWSYVEPARLGDQDSLLVSDFLDSLTLNDAGPVLYVFDNFETVHNPPQLFREISDFARLPNKVLITTRHREFKGDWPLDVEGMSREEFDSLVNISGRRLKIQQVLAGNSKWVDSLYKESGGHPYVVKVALGEVARSKKAPQKFERIMASRDEILDALFERSFNRLSPTAQRVFFTLCKWRARIPGIALEAVMTRPANVRMDVESALNHLEDSSLVERAYSEVDAESFLHVPAAAYRFGTGQLRFAEISQAVDDDARFLHMFGAVADNVTKTGFGAHVHRFYDTAKHLKGEELTEAIAIGEYVARRYPESWMLLGELQRSAGGQGRVAAKKSYQSYLARRPDDADAWLELAALSGELNDGIGELRAASQASINAERRYGRLSGSLLSIRERVESGRLVIDSRQKREFLGVLCSGWHPRENQASVGDCFNLAKVAERGDDPEEMLFWAERGLRRDRNNQRLLDLRRRAAAVISGRPS